MNKFINYTNHPSINWSEAQLQAAKIYGEIIDMAFPEIDPHWDESQIYSLACNQVKEILALKPKAVLVQGEFPKSEAAYESLLAYRQKAVSSGKVFQPFRSVSAERV